MTDLAQDDLSLDGLRCALWSRAADLDPVGTTGSHRGYLLADVALPWPSDLGRLDEVAAVQAVLAGTGIRFQATVPVGEHRVVLYWPVGDGPVGVADPALGRSEVSVGGPGTSTLVAAAEVLLAGGGDHRPGPRREVLVCTHGRRDVCCGSQGSRLFLELADHPDQAGRPRPLGADVDVRRTSHTGGHRFAPTAVVLPEGTGWAYLDVKTLSAVVDRRGPVSALLGHYRGWTGLGSPRLQALERAVLAEVGWDLLDRPRAGEDRGGDVMRLSVAEPGGGTSMWEATVTPGRSVARPECGQPVATARKADTELVVGDLRRSGD